MVDYDRSYELEETRHPGQQQAFQGETHDAPPVSTEIPYHSRYVEKLTNTYLAQYRQAYTRAESIGEREALFRRYRLGNGTPLGMHIDLLMSRVDIPLKISRSTPPTERRLILMTLGVVKPLKYWTGGGRSESTPGAFLMENYGDFFPYITQRHLKYIDPNLLYALRGSLIDVRNLLAA